MIKEITEYNKKITNEMLLNENAECLINSLLDSNGNLNLAYLKGQIPDKLFTAFEEFLDMNKFSETISKYKKELNDSGVGNNAFVKNIINESYGLNFLGKSLGKVLARQKSTTIFVPDEKNNEEINKNSKNVYITADNLEALRHLKNSYSGRIKCIYIDPPYNTGSDGFCYPDNFYDDVETIKTKFGVDDSTANAILGMTSNKSNSHNAWLSFMYPRLLLAKELLSEEGCIFISIDDHEYANLKILCDIVFDEKNYMASVINRTKAGGSNDSNDIAVEHEYLLCYKKDYTVIGKIELNEKRLKEYKYEDEKIMTHGKYTLKNLNDKSLQDSKGLHFDILCPDGSYLKGSENQWKCNEETFKNRLNDNRIVFTKKSNGQWICNYKIYLNEEKGELVYDDDGNIRTRGQNLSSIQIDDLNGTDDFTSLGFDGKLFKNPKPISMIEKLLQVSMKKEDIFLDFFCGSSSSIHSFLNYLAKIHNCCNYIAVQVKEEVKENLKRFEFNYIDEIGMERIRRAAKKIKEETGADIDYGFKHYTLIDKGNTIDKLEKFDENSLSINYEIMEEFDSKSLLTTFAVDDGFGLNPYIEEIDLDGYIAYRVENKEWTEEVVLYLLDKGFEDKHYQKLIKISNERCLNISKVIVFGYAFSMRELQLLNANISQLGIKFNNSIKLKPIIRY